MSLIELERVENISLGRVRQIRDVLPVEKWVEEYYYSGPVSMMYSFWKEKLCEAYNRGVDEVIVIGSVGGGKTTFANALLMRKIYELSCFEPVSALYNLLAGTKISFLYFSVNLRQAFRTGYGKLLGMIDETPYFRDVFKRDEDISSVIKFKDIEVYAGSTFEHQVGLELLGAVLDEANFYKAKDPFEKAQKIYTAVIDRRKSRFVVDGKDYGLSVLVSSAEEPSSFVEDRISKLKGKENVLIVSAVAYELKRKNYTGDSFIVFIGNEFISPRIVEGINDLVSILRYMNVGDDVIEEAGKFPVKFSVKYLVPEPYNGFFKEVPGEFKRGFEEDIIRAVRDIIGVSVGGENKLFKGISLYEEALEGENVFVRDVVKLSSKDSVGLKDYFDISRVRDRDKGRYIHIDLGITKDRTGIACAYVDGVKKEMVGREVVELPVIRVEWMVGIEKETVYGEDEVPIWKIRDFLLWLKNQEINVVKVTFDSYQSLDAVQLLTRMGFDVERLSVDRTDEPYLNLVSVYLERRIKHPEHIIYRKELFGLEYDTVKRKVDHVGGGTKDVSDAVAGAVYSLCKNFSFRVEQIDDFLSWEEKEKNGFDLVDKMMEEMKKNKNSSKRNWIVGEIEWER